MPPQDNNSPIAQMAADPDFGKMQVSEQRKALTAHDPSFGKMGDNDISQFVSAHQQKAAPANLQTDPSSIYAPAANATGLSAPPKMFSKQWFKEKGINLGLDVADASPGLGATAGGVLGATGGTLGAPGPGSVGGGIAGAATGGMGGEALKQLIYRGLGWGGPQTGAEASKKIVGQGLLQGGIEATTAGLPFLAGPLQRTATTQYERALAPTTKINKAITQDISPELIQRGEYGSLGGLEKKAGQKISQLSPELNTAYQQASSLPTSTGSLPATLPGSGTKVIQDLEALKQTYMPGGQIAQPQAVNAIGGVQDIVKQYGPDVDATTLRRLRQIFEDPVAQRGGYAGADLSTSYTLNAQKQAADSIRGILNKNPDIGALNKEISFWLDVQRVTSQSGLRQTGQSGGLLKVLSPLAAGGAAATTGMQFGAVHGMEAGVATALTTMAYQAMRSPTWRTASAILKDRFAQALASGDVGAAAGLLSRFGVATMGAAQRQQPQAPTTPPFLPQGQQP